MFTFPEGNLEVFLRVEQVNESARRALRLSIMNKRRLLTMNKLYRQDQS